MLTKDLLKYSIRGDRVFPKYIKPVEPHYRALAAELESNFNAFVGRKFRDLNDELRQHKDASDVVFQGFCKLLEDRCTFGEPDEAIEKKRWDWMKAAQELRQSDFENYRDFQLQLEQSFACDFATIESELYGDLAENRAIVSFEMPDDGSLLHRYNLSQIQGLLLRSQKVSITIQSSDVLSRRRLLQKLRFCRLFAEFPDESSKDTLSLVISGPLTIFEQAQSYGLRLCNFFPYVLFFNKWILEAEVRLGQKTVELKVDSSRPIASHYKEFNGYIPEEFKALLDNFNQLSLAARKGWTAEEGRESFNLGRQNYCIPDFTFQHTSGVQRHCELFHRWHKNELKRRLGQMPSEQADTFFFGIAKELLKDPELEEKLAQFQLANVSTFTFRQFPTVKAIMTYLATVKVE